LADRVKFTLTLLLLTLAFVAAQTAFASRPSNDVKIAPSLSAGEAAAVRIKPKGKIQEPVFPGKGLKDIEGLVLKQEFRFIGKCTTYFSPLGISVESNSLSILFNSKTQNLCLYSDDTKKYYACDPETWKKKSKVMFQNPTSHPRLTAWKFLRNEKVCGMNTKVFSRFSYMTSMTNEDTIWVTHDVDLTADARSLLYALLKVTDAVPEGVPLRHALASKYKAVVEKKADFLGRHRVRKGKDSDHVDYETFSIQKGKIPVSKYIMPSGYKRSESEMEVFFNTEDSMGDLEIPDLGSEKSKKKMLPQKFK
jgi:hypothetical protein